MQIDQIFLMLHLLIDFQELNLDSIKQLENASEILKSAVDQLKKGKSDMEHFGD